MARFCATLTAVAFLLAGMGGCAIPQGYDVKVGAGYEDQQGNEYGGYVSVSHEYKNVQPIKLPKQYQGLAK